MSSRVSYFWADPKQLTLTSNLSMKGVAAMAVYGAVRYVLRLLDLRLEQVPQLEKVPRARTRKRSRKEKEYDSAGMRFHATATS